MKKYLKYIIPVLIPMLLQGLYLLTRNNRRLMNGVIRYMTNPYKRVMEKITDYLPFAVSEVIYAVLIITVFILLIRSLFFLFKRSIPLKTKLKKVSFFCYFVFVCILWLYVGFTATWGINFYGDSFLESTNLTDRAVSPEELYSIAMDYTEHLNELAPRIERDESGIYAYPVKDLLHASDGLFDSLSSEFPYLLAKDHRPKGLFFSRIMSYIDMTGYYFPFTGEANVNTDAPAALLPATICHELSHQRGVTNEDEANFLAILACIRSDDISYVYSGYLFGWIYLVNALYKADKDLYAEVYDTLCEEARIDNSYNSNYWRSLRENKIAKNTQKVSNKVYSSFIKSYGEADVMKKYGACVDLLVDYTFGH